MAAERAGIGLAFQVPEPMVAREGARFVMPAVDLLDTKEYVEAADKVLNGKLRVFKLELETDEWNWNSDPKSGTVASLAYGKAMNYRDASAVGDIKYLWEPNRHLQLVVLAQAYALTGQERYLDGLRRQITGWIEQCPYPRGANWASSLELGIRLINWSLVWQLIGGSSSPVFAGDQGARFKRDWLKSVYQHIHFIRGHRSAYSSANNHLIGELSGIFIAALTWPHWPQSMSWAKEAQTLLIEEAERQNHGDGVNREQAIAYQQFVLDFLILAGLAGDATATAFPPTYWAVVERMLEFIASVLDVGRNVPMIGDADDGYVVDVVPTPDFCPFSSLLATGAVIFGRSDFRRKAGTLDDKTIWLIGPNAPDRFKGANRDPSVLPTRRRFGEGGYYILGSDFETPREVRLLIDCGPLGYLSIAAHGHADALSIYLSAAGREFLIDPGTYAYHTQSRWRDYFRGTAAHNTVTIDEMNQSEITGNFMWRNHARASCEIFESGEREDHFRGQHDGYMRLKDPVMHCREVVFDKTRGVASIRDNVTADAVHTVDRWWHFSENCLVERQGNSILAMNDGVQVSLTCLESDTDWLVLRGSDEPLGGWVSRQFDRKVQCTSIRWRIERIGNCVLESEINVRV